MAVPLFRETWIQVFKQMRRPRTFLSDMFTVPNGGFYKGKKVNIDIQRFGEDIAIPVTACKGPNLNDLDEFTTKQFAPPAYGEAVPLDVCDLLTRMAGVDPYSAERVSYEAQMMAYMSNGFRLIFDKIVRGIELQAAQILQTGKLELTDEENDTVFTLDFQAKTEHFPTTSVSWSDTANADPIGDLEALAEVIRANGHVNPNMLIMGSVAYNNALKNQQFKDCLDNRRISVGEINPRFENSGATRKGFIWIGDYEFQIWTYPETYKNPDPNAAEKTLNYLAKDKVVMLSDDTRLDKTFAEVPCPLGPDPRVANLLPGRLSDRSENMDVTPNVYCTPNGKQIWGELESRPLLIPTQIDGFGCLDTEV